MNAHPVGLTADAVIKAACNQIVLNVEQMAAGVDDAAYRQLTELGLNENQIKLIERFPTCDESFVTRALERLCAEGIVRGASYSTTTFDDHKNTLIEYFCHGDRITYIFPEEARLLYALAEITKPVRVAFMGAYYGYWAAWALPAIHAAGGKTTLLDIDRECVSLARRNVERLGFASSTEVLERDAVLYMEEGQEEFDWVVLDAEGPKSGVAYDRTDKALYFPMARAACARIRPGGLLICHNILLWHHNNDPYFANTIRNNTRQFYRFLPFVQTHFSRMTHICSTEGIGVYQR